MVSNVRYLCRKTTYAEIRNVLMEMQKLRSFPVVEDSSIIFFYKFLKIRKSYKLQLLQKQLLRKNF